MKARILALLSLTCFLSSCGPIPSDRIISGAGVGAGVATVGSLIWGVNPLVGMAIGAAVGATAGGVTGPGDIDLGRPFWRQ